MGYSDIMIFQKVLAQIAEGFHLAEIGRVKGYWQEINTKKLCVGKPHHVFTLRVLQYLAVIWTCV